MKCSVFEIKILTSYGRSGCFERANDEFWILIDEKTAEVPTEDAVVVVGDLNGHIGSARKMITAVMTVSVMGRER